MPTIIAYGRAWVNGYGVRSSIRVRVLMHPSPHPFNINATRCNLALQRISVWLTRIACCIQTVPPKSQLDRSCMHGVRGLISAQPAVGSSRSMPTRPFGALLQVPVHQPYDEGSLAYGEATSLVIRVSRAGNQPPPSPRARRHIDGRYRSRSA